ncbi:gliding motility-associated C-terminal domain-containing protein [Lutibacter oricola]|uniref:Gliding motility-associated C-terminal domain-containing protein n=1 Tax=Lutibacter oricola TaxID=762486 RepID=A0A1H3AF98_9FLAO|nr:T9SS type B sorting domain-containing protein [Lutibacter oricola]SDX27519.1 gliding motility-associated C-terminal domain-containing protein [Lutibacter oricola]
MKKANFNYICSIIVVLFFTQISYAQLSKTHYIPPLTSASLGNANPEEQYIYISTPNAVDINYTIIPIGQPTTSYITGTVSNTTPQEIFLGNGNGQLFIPSTSTSVVVNNRGYIIEAEDVIYVSVRMEAGGGAQAGALVSKGLASLGKTFRVGSYTNENPQDNYLNFVSVMATEDNTQVTFSDLPAGLVIKNYSGTTPVTTTLNEGESYTIATNSFDAVINRDGLIGCLVTSDKNIVVNCGSANGSFDNGGGRDYGIDQIVDLTKVGTEYIFVKGDGDNDWENVLLVAHTDGTTISINGNTPVATINAGEYYLIEGNQYNANGNMYVETSEPVFAYQGVGVTSSEANQGMFFVPPLSCETRGNLDNIANIESIGTTTYTGGISIVTKSGSTVTINNQPITNFSTIGPSTVDGNTDYVTYKVTGLSGNISVQSTDELYCAYFNYNGSATSGSFYSGFPTAPEINFNTAFVTLGICIPNVTLEVANMGNFDEIEWFFDDGTGFVGTGVKTLQYVPTVSGTYKLIGILNCSGLTLESLEVPVSICPDDYDTDGIIDNLDIDNDNDGILNCTESYGDVDISLANPLSGSLPSTPYTFNGTITPTGNAANSLVGAADGSFKSDVSDKNGLLESSLTYNINFNQDLNLLFKLPTSTPLGAGDLNSDQEFIIKVSNTKTITLVDPDDQLLVDTNYDGVYETGITQFSSFEIRFKINGTSLAPSAGTFSFVASMVDSFSYTHKNTSDTTSNNATFKIKATCLPIDTDGDGITDEFDYDSENDGIPDYIEVNGLNNVLSGVDADSNGLDDMFDITTAPIDTDADGVWDFYDLDSDNDGIYDVYESRSGLLDVNFDGVIDSVISTIGINGWDDNAETTPDIGVIGYTLNDLDTDTVFSYIDFDSDGDNCSDVIEAGFSDGNNDNFLGDTPFTVNNDGVVNNASDGFTAPNSEYNTAGIITIITQPINTVSCNTLNSIFEIEINAVDSIQWQVSTDNGTNWTDIIDDATYTGSLTDQLTISNVPLTFNNYQYRVQLQKNGNSCGLISDEVILTVNPLPIANAVNNLELCDNLNDGDDTNGLVQGFNLESQSATVLGTQSTADYTVTYHTSLADAQTGTAPQASPFTNTTANSQTIYVSVENNTTGCRKADISFDVIVNPLPFANTVSNLVLCDNLDDGNNTNGLVQSFDLESQTSTILGTQPSTDFTVTYHTSLTDAETGTAPQASPFTNTIANSQTIYVRVENNTTNCVNSKLTFNVIVNPLPMANTVVNLESCDNLNDSDDTNGIIQSFDLESQTSTILGTQPSTDYAVTYHLSTTDAETGTAPQASPFTNTIANSQTIYVRVENNTTNCVNSELTFDLIVHPLPIITTPVVLKQCDNDTDGFSDFNLTEVNAEISTNYLNETISFYETQAEAIAGTPAITNPTMYTNATVNNDVVWARIESTFGCFRTSEVQLVVSTTGIPSTFQRTFNVCDDYLDTINDDRDGISTFDFSSVDAEVRAIFPAGQQLFIKYYRNETDALAETNEIVDISNYRNIGYPNSQQIYIRVDSQLDNDCLGFGDYITLNVEALPTANSVTITRQCDDDTDGMYPFDITAIESTVLNGQTNVTVSYVDELGNPLPSPLPNPFLTTSQTITIRVTNNVTADPNGACFDETTLEFIVDEAPAANAVTIAPVCDDESNDGIHDFDTSTIQATILGTQAFDVLYFDELGNALPSPLPNPFTTSTQTISVQVINPANTTCIANTTIDFVVNPLPDFEVVTPQILCLTTPASTITLGVTQNNPLETLDYEWFDPLNNSISTNTTLDVNADGIYSVALTKTDGTNCTRIKEIEIKYSQIATITSEDITIVDDSDNNTITINNASNNLGLGEYEFSLIDMDGNTIKPFQTEPFFDYVAPGFYTILVQDINNCGITPIDISVIGYPKFLTPNNDGTNDYWQIQGVNENFYSKSIIYIFDRFGKLITKINPRDKGWNGTFNGKLLPSTDYWFTAELIDDNGNIKIKKGHFSLIRN